MKDRQDTLFTIAAADASVDPARAHAGRISALHAHSRRWPLARLAEQTAVSIVNGAARAQYVWPSSWKLRHLADVLKRVEGKSVVSFDFFDTLVKRHASSPARVLRKSAELSADLLGTAFGIYFDPDHYWRERVRTERELARENRIVWRADEESSLPCIVRALVERLGFSDESLISQLVELEFELEAEGLALSNGAKEVLQCLHDQGKTLVVTSDMYLTAGHLARVCERLGIDRFFSGYYASGDLLLNKKSARLFAHVLEAQNCVAGELLHVGDKHHNDFLMPRSLGVTALWLPAPAASVALSESWRLDTRRALSRMDELILAHANSFGSDVTPLERTLMTGAAPGLYAMAYKILRDSRRMGLARLYFLARDAIPLQPVFDLLLARHPEFRGYTPETRILHCSRASTVCARLSLRFDAQTVLRTALERFTALNVDNLLSAWNIDPAEVGVLQGLGGAENEIDARQLAEQLEANSDFRRRFEEAIRCQQEMLYRYLVQEGLTKGSCALIDVGWGGTIQQHLQQLLQARGHRMMLVGFYLGTDQRLGLNHCKGYLFCESDYRTESIMRSASLTETLLSCRGIGSTSGYVMTGSRIGPVLRPASEPHLELEAARSRALERYLELFLRLTRQHAFLESELIEHGRRRYFEMVTRPDRSFVEAVEELEFQFDWGYQDSRKLVARATWREILLPGRLAAKLWRNPWVFGSLKASGLGVLNRPLTWLLGIDQRISRRMFDVLKRLLVRRPLPHRVV